MRRVTWIAVFVVGLAILLSGCGKKDAGAVVKDLDHAINKLKSYKGVGTMVIHAGQAPQVYEVEVWYQTPKYYRIALTNEKKDITQIVLKNDSGVYVLTPHLNKSFRFQSDWPESQGQVYVYQSLVSSILIDKERQMTVDKGAYVFDVKGNYQNSSFARQRIWLDMKSHAPKRVEVHDHNTNLLVEMNFSAFQFDAKFDEDSFDMQRNMTSSAMRSLPTTAIPDLDDTAGISDQAKAILESSIGMIEPSYIPPGIKKLETQELMQADGKSGAMLRYTGDYSFTIMESRPETRTVFAAKGNVIDLDYTQGIMIGEGDMRTLVWINDGIEFRLSSGDLPENEMIKVAKSMENQIGK